MKLPTAGPDLVTRSQQIRYGCAAILVVEALVVLVWEGPGSGLPLAGPLFLLFAAGLSAVLAYLEPLRRKRFRLADTSVIGAITAVLVLGLVTR